MFASEKLVADQSAKLREVLGNGRFPTRSLPALAKIINENETTTVDLLASIGAELDHVGTRTGKKYYNTGPALG